MVTFVATAICADRSASAAPSVPPQMASAARRLAGRLVLNLRRTVPAVRFEPYRRDGRAAASVGLIAETESILIYPAQTQPFQFRLPPPAL
jgi:hypothetical protein